MGKVRGLGAGFAAHAKMLLAFCVGIVVGALLQSASSGSNNKTNNNRTEQRGRGVNHGLVLRLEDLEYRKTSHTDTMGRPIVKKQFLEPFVVPNFAGFAVATFQPGQILLPPHQHQSMHEFFYVVHGTGFFQKDGVNHTVQPGTFLHFAPHEQHGMWVPQDSTNGDLQLIMCGVTVDEE